MRVLSPGLPQTSCEPRWRSTCQPASRSAVRTSRYFLDTERRYERARTPRVALQREWATAIDAPLLLGARTAKHLAISRRCTRRCGHPRLRSSRFVWPTCGPNARARPPDVWRWRLQKGPCFSPRLRRLRRQRCLPSPSSARPVTPEVAGSSPVAPVAGLSGGYGEFGRKGLAELGAFGPRGTRARYQLSLNRPGWLDALISHPPRTRAGSLGVGATKRGGGFRCPPGPV